MKVLVVAARQPAVAVGRRSRRLRNELQTSNEGDNLGRRNARNVTRHKGHTHAHCVCATLVHGRRVAGKRNRRGAQGTLVTRYKK